MGVYGLGEPPVAGLKQLYSEWGLLAFSEVDGTTNWIC